MMADPDFPRLREAAGFPFSMTGRALTDYVKKAVDDSAAAPASLAWCADEKPLRRHQ
ncbi:hypothetical protein ACHMW6_26025 [Pseudoduganella sp. UC29_106]|uniref:hypothetical protein n=1 Tax=Pseudoduganella sp. UC29_106 TaxID=3374553 RepID=UPI003757D5DA